MSEYWKGPNAEKGDFGPTYHRTRWIRLEIHDWIHGWDPRRWNFRTIVKEEHPLTLPRYCDWVKDEDNDNLVEIHVWFDNHSKKLSYVNVKVHVDDRHLHIYSTEPNSPPTVEVHQLKDGYLLAGTFTHLNNRVDFRDHPPIKFKLYVTRKERNPSQKELF